MLDFETALVLPRGDAANPVPLKLDMTAIRAAETRLSELQFMRQGSAIQLMGFFNEAAAVAQRHLALVSYELVVAKQKYDRSKAHVMLNVMPKKLDELKAQGIKGNDDIRSALLSLDPDCFLYQDRVDCLTAAHVVIENKIRTFVRAYAAAKVTVESRFGSATERTLNSPGLQNRTFDASELKEIQDLGLGSDPSEE